MPPSTGPREIASPQALFSATACLRCRQQKLKCSRELPACNRCCKVSTTSCVYPNPPNRRVPRTKRKSDVAHQTPATPTSFRYAEQRVPETPASAHIPSVRQLPLPTPTAPRPAIETPGSTRAEYVSTPVFSNSYQNQLHTATPRTSLSIFDSSQPPPLPPTSLGLALLEVYFARIYNSASIFYKPLLFHQYVEGKVDATLLRALFALASIFVRPDSVNEELRALSIYHASGISWAKAATRESMQLAMESPSLATAQTLQCVQIYWFCTGHPHPGKLCLTLAYRLCQLLGYNTVLRPDSQGIADSMELELGRRCFWAAWASTCVVVELEPAWKDVALLPLPGHISTTPQGYAVVANQAMGEDLRSVSVQEDGATKEYCTTFTPVGSLTQIFGVWAKVQLLCKAPPASITPAALASVYRLSDLASSLFNEAQSARARTSQHDSTIEDENLCLLHDGVYHVCQIILHSLLVPLLSEIPAEDSIGNHRQVQSRAAETVMQHVDQFVQQLLPHVQGVSDVSRLSPFLAYNAFIVSMVILTTEVARHSQAATDAPGSNRVDPYGRVAAAEQIESLLNSLRVYWVTLEHPWERLRAALQTYHSMQRNQPEQATGASDQTAKVDSASLESAANNSDLGPVQDDMFPEFPWHSLSLADAGLEQLAEFELSSLFQQGWVSFS